LCHGFWGDGQELAPISPHQEVKADVNAAVNIRLRYTAVGNHDRRVVADVGQEELIGGLVSGE